MKKLTYIILVIIIQSSAWSQSINHVIFPNAEFLKQTIIDDGLSYSIYEAFIAACDNEITLCKPKAVMTDNNTVLVELINIISDNTIFLEFPVQIKGQNLDIMAFTCNNNFIVFADSYKLYIFDRKNNNKLIQSITLDFIPGYLKIDDGIVYLYSAEISSSLLRKKKSFTCYAKYSIFENNMSDTYFFKDPFGFVFYTSKPRYTYDIYTDKSNIHFIADPIRYNIEIYDNTHENIFTIKHTPELWDYYPNPKEEQKLLKKAAKAVKSYNMNKVWKYSDKIENVSSLISKISYQSPYLYVLWSKHREGDNGYECLLDVWKKDTASYNFSLLHSNIHTSDFENVSHFLPEKLSIWCSSIILNNYLIVSNYNPFKIEELDNKEEDECEKMKRKYYMNNDMKMSIYIYKLKND